MKKLLKPHRLSVVAAVVLALLVPSSALAQDGPTIDLPSDVGADVSAMEKSRKQSTGIGGYAELHYNWIKDDDADEGQAELDLHRLVMFLSHTFGKGLSFYTEIEVEHAVAGDGQPGEVSIEQGYVEYAVLDWLSIKAGIMLVPMGLVNRWHEPPTFNGVERTNVDRVVIPSTWREAGIGVAGAWESLRYELYIMGGLNPAGFKASSGLRSGRMKAAEARADALAVSARLEYEPILGLLVGLSGYGSLAGANADLVDAAGNDIGADVGIFGGALDVRLRRWGVEAAGQFAMFSVGDSDKLATAVDSAGDPLGIVVGSKILGAYAELGWDVFFLMETEHQLVPFFRYELVDTLFEVTGADVESAVTDLVFGVSYRPISQVAFKADYTLRSFEAGGGEQRLSLGVGTMF